MNTFQEGSSAVNELYSTNKKDMDEDFKKKLAFTLIFGSIFGCLVISSISLYSIASSLGTIAKLMEAKQRE